MSLGVLLRSLLGVFLGLFGLTVLCGCLMFLLSRREWSADEGGLRRFYASLGDSTELMPRDPRRSTYNLIWRNCAAFPAWLFPKRLACDGWGYMHPAHCKLERVDDGNESTALPPSGRRLMLEWLALAPELPQRQDDLPPGLEWNLERFLLTATHRGSDVRVLVASTWVSALLSPVQHLTTLLLTDRQMLSLGVDGGRSSPLKLLLGSFVYKLCSPDRCILRHRYRHCRILADYHLAPPELLDLLRKVREEWQPVS